MFFIEVHNEKKLIKVAKMYYEKNMIQSEIADKLGVSRSLIAKYLNDAKKLGLIEIVVKDENNYTASLELELEQKYALKDALIIDSKGYSEDEIPKIVSQYGASYFVGNTKKYDKIGISWGKSLRRLVDALPFHNHPKAKLIPLVGGLSETNFNVQSNQLAYDVARKMRGETQYLYTPAFVSNKSIKKELGYNSAVRSVIENAKKVDIALVGITTLNKNLNLKMTGYINDNDIESLEKEGAIGVINSRFFNQEGIEIDHYINDSAMGLNLEDIKSIPDRMAVVYDNFKIPALNIALEKKLINIIVTTNTIAEKLLDN